MKNDGLFAYHLQLPNWIIEEGERLLLFSGELLLHFLFLSFAQTHKSRPMLESHKRSAATATACRSSL